MGRDGWGTMAVMNFIQDARIAWSALAAGKDRPPAEAAARWMASRNLWLAPDVLTRFDPTDCIFHTADQQQELAARAEQFRATAAGLAGRRLTRSRVAEAAGQLGGLLESLAEYFTRPEGQALVRALWAGPAPGCVLALDYDLGTDWSGAPAIYAWVITKADPAQGRRSTTSSRAGSRAGRGRPSGSSAASASRMSASGRSSRPES